MTERQIPKFNRQRLLLFLLEAAGDRLSKMDFQKLLFLAHRDSDFAYYDFVPYHYGCYSFQAASDLELLEKRGWVKICDRCISLADKPYTGTGTLRRDRFEMARLMRKYQTLRGEALVKAVYMRFPYYAINSKIADRLVERRDAKKIATERRLIQNDSPTLFTIGYEGVTFEAYVNKLIQNNVRLLCDVRKNPLSRKFGFSKGILSTTLPKLGIEYRHVPQLGIVSDKRQKLNTPQDYERLFNEYSRHLPKSAEQLDFVKVLFEKHDRIALTCFEKQPRFCHRSRISDYLEDKWHMKVTHL